MTEKSDITKSNTAASWDKYWQGDQASPAFSDHGVSHVSIHDFWVSFMRSASTNYPNARLLDIASGNGAIPEIAFAEFGEKTPLVTCVDVSEAAIGNITERFPQVNGVVADAMALPFEEQSFDLITSQFGIEYAGLDAVPGARALLAPGGRLAFLMHYAGGKIDRECDQNRVAIARVIEAEFIPHAHTFFAAGFAALKGADRSAYDQAATTLGASMSEVEACLTSFGTDVASGTIARLYDDVGRIHERLQHYQPEDVLIWLEGMQQEFQAYADRMASMTASALSADEFAGLCDSFDAAEFDLESRDALLEPESREPLGWLLLARRRP